MDRSSELQAAYREIDRLSQQNESLRGVIDDSWRMAIRYPFGQVCKHLIACRILQAMEEIGFEIPSVLAKAVVTADDDTALAWEPLRRRKEHLK